MALSSFPCSHFLSTPALNTIKKEGRLRMMGLALLGLVCQMSCFLCTAAFVGSRLGIRDGIFLDALCGGYIVCDTTLYLLTTLLFFFSLRRIPPLGNWFDEAPGFLLENGRVDLKWLNRFDEMVRWMDGCAGLMKPNRTDGLG